MLNTKRFPLTYADGRQTKGRHESRACRTSGGRQTSAIPPPKKTAELPRKKDSSPRHVRKRSGSLFSGGVAQLFLPGQPQNATRSAGVSLPCSSEGARSPAGVFFAVPSRRRDALSSVPPSSAPPSSAPRQGRALPLRFCAEAHRSPARTAPRPRPWRPLRECR